MVMNVDTSNKNDRINNNDLKSQQCIVEGINFNIVLSGRQTGGKYTLLEAYFPPDSENEIPLHTHSNESLIAHVMEGTFSFSYGKEVTTGLVGQTFVFEKDISHSFKKIGQEYGRLLLMYIPAGFENFFIDLSNAQVENLKKFGEDDPVMVQLLEKNYGIRMLLNS